MLVENIFWSQLFGMLQAITVKYASSLTLYGRILNKYTEYVLNYIF